MTSVPAAWIMPTARGSLTRSRPAAATRRTRASRTRLPACAPGERATLVGSLKRRNRARLATPNSICDRQPACRSSSGSTLSADAACTIAVFDDAKAAVTCSATASIRPSLSPNRRSLRCTYRGPLGGSMPSWRQIARGARCDLAVTRDRGWRTGRTAPLGVVGALPDQPATVRAKMPLKITSLHPHIVTQPDRSLPVCPAQRGRFRAQAIVRSSGSASAPIR